MSASKIHPLKMGLVAGVETTSLVKTPPYSVGLMARSLPCHGRSQVGSIPIQSARSATVP
jgi:hypothetical protein